MLGYLAKRKRGSALSSMLPVVTRVAQFDLRVVQSDDATSYFAGIHCLGFTRMPPVKHCFAGGKWIWRKRLRAEARVLKPVEALLRHSKRACMAANVELRRGVSFK